MYRCLLGLALLFGACRAEAPADVPPAATSPADNPQREAPPPGPPDPPPAPDPLARDEAAPSADAFTGTVRSTKKDSGAGRVALLEAVRIGQHAGFDRIVFAFAGGVLPGYALEYVDRPVRNCGEGRTVPIDGQAWLQVRLTPANAHTEAGAPTAAPRERRPALPVLLEAEQTCDFEADVTWVLGVTDPQPYRVLELRDPARLVVDVRH